MRSAILVALLLAPAAAQAQQSFTLDGGGAAGTYTVVHKLHKFSATSKKADGKANIGADGKTQVLVRVPVESFDSDNVNRDAHMKETVEAAKFPTVELKAIGDGLAAPASFPSTAKKT